MQIGSQMGAVVPLYFLGEAVGWEGREPSQAMHWSPSAWPLCRCHSDSCGRTGFWRCCPQDHVHHLRGQGRGTSSGWLGCRERETGSGPKNTSTLGHQALKNPNVSGSKGSHSLQLVSFSDYHDRKAGGNTGQASLSLRSTFLAPSPEKFGLNPGTLGVFSSLAAKQAVHR